MNRQPSDSEFRERCDGCGVDVTENWEGGPNLTKLCPECATDAWDDGYDPEGEE